MNDASWAAATTWNVADLAMVNGFLGGALVGSDRAQTTTGDFFAN